jgi:antirestriction protein ArdC/uncharacterized Fe-S cluster protein YjdI
MEIIVSENRSKKGIELTIAKSKDEIFDFQLIKGNGFIFNKKSKVWFKPNAYFQETVDFLKKIASEQKKSKKEPESLKEDVLEGVPILSSKEQKALGIVDDGLGKLSDPKVIDKINEIILKGIKENKAPWQNPLSHPFVPAKSFVAKKHYTGVNAVMLGFFGTSDKGYYITAKQIKELGGTLKKGASKDNNVFFYNRYYFDTVQNKFVPIEKHNPENENEELRMTLRNYEVYAIEDTENIDHSHLPSLRVVREFSDIEQGEHFIKHLRKDAAKIIHKKTDKNSYIGGYIDTVVMSIKSDFISEERYYKTLCHELVHSTGHHSRLNRVFGKKFGDKNYAKEELVAEIGASYLCSEIGILFSTIDNTTAYIKNWLGALQKELIKDKTLMLKAMTQAYKAVEWLMDGIPKYIGEESTIKTISSKKNKKEPKTQKSLGSIPSPLIESVKEQNLKLPAGFITIDKVGKTEVAKSIDGFTLDGEIGKFIGLVENYKYAIVLDGESFSGKSRLVYMLANAFASKSKRVGIYSLEMGNAGHVIEEYRNAYISNSNKQKIAISSDKAYSLEDIKSEAKYFDVIFIDSWQKLGLQTSAKFDELRHEFPDKIWVVIFQQNAEGGTSGGSASAFNAPVHIKVYAPDGRVNYTNNYALMFKNRLTGEAGARFNLSQQKIIKNEQ